MLGRIRKSFEKDGGAQFGGPVEMDETYIGEKERNKNASMKRKAGRGPVGKTAVVGARDRKSKRGKAKVVERVDSITLHRFIRDTTTPGALLYPSDLAAYKGIRIRREAIKHSFCQDVDWMAPRSGWRAPGAGSSAATMGPTTRCRRSTCIATSASSQVGTISGSQTPWSGWSVGPADAGQAADAGGTH